MCSSTYVVRTTEKQVISRLGKNDNDWEFTKMKNARAKLAKLLFLWANCAYL